MSAKSTARRTTVLVADDHPLYRQGVVDALRSAPEIEVVAEAADGAEAMRLIRQHEPDIALLDMRMPGRTGIDVLTALRSEGLPTAVVILSAESDSATVYEAVAAGARGYVTKEASADPILDAVRTVARGGAVLPPDIQAGLVGQIRSRSDGEERPPLSPRELEVLQLTARGLSGPAIASELGIGAGTIKTHLQHIYEKLEVSERAAAVAVAMRRGLIE